MPASSSDIGRPVFALWERTIKKAISTALTTIAILGIVVAIAIFKLGSASNAIAYWQGHRVVIDGVQKSLGEVTAQSVIAIRYVVHNVTINPLTIQGVETSCTCTVVDDVPCTIQPGSAKLINVRITAPKDGHFWGALTLFTDDAEIPKLKLGYEGSVVTPNGSTLHAGNL